MPYVSTRGTAPELGFEGVLLSGLARDGGLYVPASWPLVSASDIRALDGLAYPDIAFRIVRRFIEAEHIGDDELAALVLEAYADFRHPAVAPLRPIDRSAAAMRAAVKPPPVHQSSPITS